MKRPRIVIISRLYPLPYKPHAASFNRQQFHGLAQRYPISLLVPVPWNEWIPHRAELVAAERDGIEIRYAPFAFTPKVGRTLYPTSFATSLLPHLGWLRERAPACVLASWAYPDAVGVAALSRMLGAPLLIKAHGSDINVHAQSRLRAAQLRWAVDGAVSMICVSEALKQSAMALGVPQHKLEVVYNGVDTTRFAPAHKSEARLRVGRSVQRKLVLFVGNVLQTKGVRELLHAFEIAARAHADLDLGLIGDGPEVAWLASEAKARGLGERVLLLGRLPHAALGDWFNAADVVCLPSHAEGLPNVLLEAMACGVPCVATDVGGIPEAVTAETGELVALGDVPALAAALERVLGRSWDRAAIARHAARFSWPANIEAMSALIERAIASRS